MSGRPRPSSAIAKLASSPSSSKNPLTPPDSVASPVNTIARAASSATLFVETSEAGAVARRRSPRGLRSRIARRLTVRFRIAGQRNAGSRVRSHSTDWGKNGAGRGAAHAPAQVRQQDVPIEAVNRAVIVGVALRQIVPVQALANQMD